MGLLGVVVEVPYLRVLEAPEAMEEFSSGRYTSPFRLMLKPAETEFNPVNNFTSALFLKQP